MKEDVQLIGLLGHRDDFGSTKRTWNDGAIGVPSVEHV